VALAELYLRGYPQLRGRLVELTDEEYRERAVERHLDGREDDNEIAVAYLSDGTEDVPVVKRVDSGAWVRAWLWVPEE
jgi:hypothetical protein